MRRRSVVPDRGEPMTKIGAGASVTPSPVPPAGPRTVGSLAMGRGTIDARSRARAAQVAGDAASQRPGRRGGTPSVPDAPPPIVFGTDGWRARIAEDYTYDAVRRCAQGVAEWVH